MILKVSEKTYNLSCCNGILMTLIAKTHVLTKLLHVGSGLVSVTLPPQHLNLALWSLASVQTYFCYLDSHLSPSLLRPFFFFLCLLLPTSSIVPLYWVHRTRLIYCCFH